MVVEKAVLKVANEQIVTFPTQLTEAVKKAEAEYMHGAEFQTVFANIYMDGFNEAKSLVAQAYPDLYLSQIKPVIEEDTIFQAVYKDKEQDQDGTEKDDTQSQFAK